jgi:hypothetical protein
MAGQAGAAAGLLSVQTIRFWVVVGLTGEFAVT